MPQMVGGGQERRKTQAHPTSVDARHESELARSNSNEHLAQDVGQSSVAVCDPSSDKVDLHPSTASRYLHGDVVSDDDYQRHVLQKLRRKHVFFVRRHHRRADHHQPSRSVHQHWKQRHRCSANFSDNADIHKAIKSDKRSSDGARRRFWNISGRRGKASAALKPVRGVVVGVSRRLGVRLLHHPLQFSVGPRNVDRLAGGVSAFVLRVGSFDSAGEGQSFYQ